MRPVSVGSTGTSTPMNICQRPTASGGMAEANTAMTRMRARSGRPVRSCSSTTNIITPPTILATATTATARSHANGAPIGGDHGEGDQRSRRHRGPVPRAGSMLREHPGQRKADEEQHDCGGGVDREAGRPDARTSGGLGFGERVEQRSPGEQRHDEPLEAPRGERGEEHDQPHRSTESERRAPRFDRPIDTACDAPNPMRAAPIATSAQQRNLERNKGERAG